MGIGSLRVTSSNVIFVFGKSCQTNGRDLVESLDLILSLLVIGKIAVRLPNTSSVFDLDVLDGRRFVAKDDIIESAVDGRGGSHEFVKGNTRRNHDLSRERERESACVFKKGKVECNEKRLSRVVVFFKWSFEINLWCSWKYNTCASSAADTNYDGCCSNIRRWILDFQIIGDGNKR
jgi:hypothetical protein